MDVEMPKSLENLIDLKLLTLKTFQMCIDRLKNDESITLSQKTNLIIFTSSASIMGTVVLDEDKDIRDVLNSILLSTRKSLLKQIEHSNSEVINRSGVIVIKDATIRPFSNPAATFNVAVLNIFTDQILGFSFGELQL